MAAIKACKYAENNKSVYLSICLSIVINKIEYQFCGKRREKMAPEKQNDFKTAGQEELKVFAIFYL